LIPIRDENPSSTTPVVTRMLVAVNVAAFLYELTLGPDLRDFMMQWGLVPVRLAAGLGNGLGVTLLTSMFLHGGWMHLLGNMWYLVLFGDNVEDRLGHFGYLAFYLISGVVGGLLHYRFNATSEVPTVGASAAIAGVLGAYLVAYPRARVLTLVLLFPFFQLLALPAVVVLGLWFLFQFFSGALSLAYSGAGGIAWWGHIGGFAFGALAMLVFGRWPRRSQPWVQG
jgi:membrane associated rhomboid family serine protease